MSEDAGAARTAQAYSGTMAPDGKVNASGAELIGGIFLGDTAAGIGATMGVCAALYTGR